MVQGFDYRDLGGGRNGGAAPSEIDSREMQVLENWVPYGGTRLRRRGGVRRITTGSVWAEGTPYGLFALKLNNGSWVMLVAGSTAFGRLDVDTITTLPMSSSIVFTTTSKRVWTMFQYLNYAYALRSDHGQLIRLSDSFASPAGISAPGSAPTLADGGAGALSAAVYRGVVTFANSETGMESNPSPVSNALSLAANRMINWSTIPTSTNPFVTARRLYRTLPDQTGEYFFVAQINNNTATAFTGDNVTVADLGATVSFRNGTPPAGLEVGAIWNERLFASDGVDLFFSELLMPEMFSGDFIPVNPDDGHRIRGLLGFGDRLLIGKTNKMYFLVGTDRSDFSLHVLSDTHGLKSAHSFKAAEGQAFWYGTGKAVYRTDGTAVQDISTPRVADVLAAVPDTMEEYITAAIYPAQNWYVLVLPTAEVNVETPKLMKRVGSVLVYDYKYGVWSVFNHRQFDVGVGADIAVVPTVISDAYDVNYRHRLYAAIPPGGIHHYNDETHNYDVTDRTILAKLRTKRDAFGIPGYRKFFREVWALIPNNDTGTIRIEIFRDDQAAAVLDREASLAFPNAGWKAWAANNWREPGSTLDMQLTYDGADPLDLDALHFEVGLLPHRPMRAR